MSTHTAKNLSSSSWTGRAPRTLESAFGPSVRSTHAVIEPLDEPLHPADVLVIRASAIAAAVLFVILVAERMGWFV